VQSVTVQHCAGRVGGRTLESGSLILLLENIGLPALIKIIGSYSMPTDTDFPYAVDASRTRPDCSHINLMPLCPRDTLGRLLRAIMIGAVTVSSTRRNFMLNFYPTAHLRSSAGVGEHALAVA